MSMMLNAHRALLITACLVVATTVQAGSNTSRLEVSAVVVADCRIVTSDLAFADYDPLLHHATQQLDAAAQMTMVCTRGAQAAIVIDGGRHSTGSNRALTGGTQRVSYQLYRDEGRTQVWGSEGSGLQFVSNGVARPEQVTVYGRIPPGQEVQSGVYTDVVTATVDF
jgi:spore coat protein U-like protein